MPANWKSRLVRLETEQTIGLCLSPVDLAVSKILAGREKDILFVRAMLKSGFITASDIESVLGKLKSGDACLVRERLPLCR